MNTISAETVERVWKDMSTMPPSQAPQIVQVMKNEQPLILAYLMAAGGDILNQKEREVLFYLGIVVWRIMSQGDQPLTEINVEMLANAEDSNFKMLEYLEGESEVSFIDTVALVIDNYNQHEVLKYVVEALLEDTEDDIDMKEDHKGLMMIFLKTIIDCFDKN